MSFCTNCGTQLKDENQKFCKNCASQNQRQKYDTELKTNGVKKIYKYRVAFSGKNVEVEVG